MNNADARMNVKQKDTDQYTKKARNSGKCTLGNSGSKTNSTFIPLLKEEITLVLLKQIFLPPNDAFLLWLS